MKGIVRVCRRDFLKAGALAGAGLLLGFHLPALQPADAASSAAPYLPCNAFLHIGQDDLVTVYVNKSEMGQGVYTSLPMLVAEELCCDWEKVRFQPAPVAPAYNHSQFGPIMVTGGSTSVRSEWERLSRAGAAAREMLITAAAQEWQVKPSVCRAENGVVHGPGGQFAETELLAAGSVHYAVLHPTGGRVNLPLPCSRSNQHLTGRSPGQGQPFPFGTDAGTAAGDHDRPELGMVILRGYRRSLKGDPLPVTA